MKKKIVKKTKKSSNDLKRLQAQAIIEIEKENLIMGSCWNCNPGHTRYKKYNCVILCFGCERYFYKGKDVTKN